MLHCKRKKPRQPGRLGGANSHLLIRDSHSPIRDTDHVILDVDATNVECEDGAHDRDDDEYVDDGHEQRAGHLGISNGLVISYSKQSTHFRYPPSINVRNVTSEGTTMSKGGCARIRSGWGRRGASGLKSFLLSS